MIRLAKRVIKREKTILFLFINRFIKQGKKDFIYRSFVIILISLKKLFKKTFNQILFEILDFVTPLVELRPRFASGVIYYLPTPIKPYKSVVLGLAWLVKGVKMKNERSFVQKLLMECQDILQNCGNVSRLKNDYYKLILDNRVLLYRFKNKKKK